MPRLEKTRPRPKERQRLKAKKGPHVDKEIAEILELQERQVYRSLKSLQSIEIVKASGEHPVQFSAVPSGGGSNPTPGAFFESMLPLAPGLDRWPVLVRYQHKTASPDSLFTALP